ncbi:MAG: hypothetical protein AAF986_05540, partial [Pseudomonadota bacterium]
MLVVFSFVSEVRLIRFILVCVSVFNALIAAGVSRNSSEFRGFEYIAADYYAVAFFAVFSAIGFLSAVLISQRKWLLRSILIVNCFALGFVAFHFEMLARTGLKAHLLISQPIKLDVFRYSSFNVFFLPLLVLSLVFFVIWYTLRTLDQRKQRLIKSATISMFVVWSVFLSYPLALHGDGTRIYKAFPFDS